MLLFMPLSRVASLAALYPIQSIIVIALFVSEAYFHLLGIIRNSPNSLSAAEFLDGTPLVPYHLKATAWGQKDTNRQWKWTVNPTFDLEDKVRI
jgi:hypothetical protein